MYKIANEYEPIFRDYNLTELREAKDGKKKKLSDNFSVYTLLNSFLRDYGIFISGGTVLMDLQGKEQEGIKLTGFFLDQDFPTENAFLIEQLCGWDDAILNVMLILSKNDENCGYSFDYNTNTKVCTLRKDYYGSTTNKRDFDSVESLFAAIKEAEDLNEIFEIETVEA